MNKKVKGLFAISIPVLAWGISFVSTEVLMEVMGPITICFIRFLLAVLFLLPILILTKQDFKVNRQDYKLFIAGGAIGIGMYFIFENIGIKLISASPASLIIAAIPIVTLLADSVINKKKLTPTNIMTCIMSIVGVALIINLSFKDLFSDMGIGYLLMLGAVLTWVLYSIVTDKLFDRYSYLVINFYQMLISLGIFFPFLFIEETHWEMMDSKMILHLLFLSFISSVLGFIFYSVAMDLIGISEASLYINFLPIVTIIASYMLLGHTISFNQVIGGALVLIAVTINTTKSMRLEKASSTRHL